MRTIIVPVIMFFLLIYSNHSSAQKKVEFVLNGTTADDSVLIRKITGDVKAAKDTSDLNQKLEVLLLDLRREGFGVASIDSVSGDSVKHYVHLYVGPKFNWVKLETDQIEPVFLEGTPLKKKGLYDRTFNTDELEKIRKRIVRNCENNGYPFASVRLNDIVIEGEKINAKLSLEKNKLIRIDSILIKGNATIAPVYIYNYIGIFPGDVYNEIKLQRIGNRLKELPFVKEIRSSQVSFSEKLNRLYLFLDNKKASQFDGVIGLLPDEARPGKLNLTGEVHLKLQNSFRRGEIIELNWKQLPPRSQDLRVRLFYPFLFNTPFGIDANLNIFRRDTIFIDVIRNIGIQYALYGNNFIRVFVNTKESNLQSTRGLENITVLPAFADITTTSYGTTVHFERLDYRLNPMNGFALEVTGTAGNRNIRKNSDINPAVYDSLQLKSTTFQINVSADLFIPLGGKNVLNIGSTGGLIENPELFTNELFRIGGLRSLRGFDEESIFTSGFVIGKLEYRYLLEQNSFLFLFYNHAWYERNRKGNYLRDTPFGFGAGINFETRLGIMSVSYALGKQGDNPFFFRNGKVHFGIVNYF